MATVVWLVLLVCGVFVWWFLRYPCHLDKWRYTFGLGSEERDARTALSTARWKWKQRRNKARQSMQEVERDRAERIRPLEERVQELRTEQETLRQQEEELGELVDHVPRPLRLYKHALLFPGEEALGDWSIAQEVVDNAELVLSELMTNALLPVPGDRQVGVRIAHSAEEGLLRLEVSDAGGGRPEVREPGDDETRGRGLLLVEAVAHRWGYEERAAGIGKTVFVELKAPDIVAEPSVREVAAVMVRRGQHVRVWGEWRTVLGVHSEQHATGGSVVVLALDEGPALRVRAVEPLAVRGGCEPDNVA